MLLLFHEMILIKLEWLMSAEKQGEVIANTGAEFVSAEGTWLLKKGERVLSKKEGADQAYYKGVRSP